MAKYVYMKVTRDEYEFPIAIADSVTELAEILGVAPMTISSAICHANQRNGNSAYKKVNISEEDNACLSSLT